MRAHRVFSWMRYDASEMKKSIFDATLCFRAVDKVTEVKVNSHCTRHDASSFIAMRRVAPHAFLSVHTGKVLLDIFSYNGVTTTRHASRSRFKNSDNSLNCNAKAKKKR